MDEYTDVVIMTDVS